MEEIVEMPDISSMTYLGNHTIQSTTEYIRKRIDFSRPTRMRWIFTDGFNSAWHFIFGIAAVQYIVIAPIFILYQALQGKPNDVVDIVEFAIGYIFGKFYFYRLAL